MFNEFGLIILSSLLILAGIAGAVIPLLPGPPLALAGLIVYGLFTDFQDISRIVIIIFAVLTVLTMLVDIFAPMLGAKGYKSTKYGTWGALLGAILGLLLLGPLGVFIGPFIGGFIGEYWAIPSTERALKTSWGVFIGILVGTLFKFMVSIAMAVYFAIILFS